MNGKFLPNLSRRFLCAVLAIITLVMMFVGSSVNAQTTGRKLRVGDTVTGTLDARTFAQTYSFDATTGDTVSIVATANTRGLLLALLLTDTNGQTIQQVAELTRQEVEIRDFKPTTGTYYITVLRATGVQGNTVSSFSLALSGTLAPTAAASGPVSAATTPQAAIRTVTLTQGMSVALTWNTTDDLNLEVRDPIGGSVNLNSPEVASGGRFSGNTNGDCRTATAASPTERSEWAKGAIPLGSYEVIVYYVKSCAQVASANAFTVTVTVDGKVFGPIRGELRSVGQNYVASFIVSAADQVQVQQGGLLTGVDVNPFLAKIAAPIALDAATNASGTIDRNNPADVFAINVAAGESFSIAMRAVNGGSLDPYLVLLGPTNVIVTENDDENETTRNSLISVRNATAGTYKVVATRFGLVNGGTEGSYQLIISRGTGGQIVAPIPTNINIPGTGAAPTSVAAGIPTLSVAGGAVQFPRGSIEALLSWNSRADLRILIRDPRGQSLYTDFPRVDSGGVLVQTANLRCAANNTLNPVNYAYWSPAAPPAGTYEVKVFLQSTCGDTAPTQFSLKVNVAGKQVINIENQPPGAEKEVFLTTFTVDSNGNAVKGPSGFVSDTFALDISSALTSAKEITFGQTLQDEIAPTAFYKLFFFKGLAGDKVTITMKRGANNVLDSYLVLLAPDGKSQLTFNDDATVASGQPGGPVVPPDSQIVYTLTQDGNHIIVATRYGVDLGGTTGTFRLTLSR